MQHIKSLIIILILLFSYKGISQDVYYLSYNRSDTYAVDLETDRSELILKESVNIYFTINFDDMTITYDSSNTVVTMDIKAVYKEDGFLVLLSSTPDGSTRINYHINEDKMILIALDQINSFILYNN